MAEVFTETEKRMLAVLSDGLPHYREELHRCLVDDLGPLSNIRAHLSNIRKKLAGRGEGIICELNCNQISYRHVRLLRQRRR